MKYILLLSILFPVILFSQKNDSAVKFPVDTSFTIYSAAAKLVNTFPEANLVKPFVSKLIIAEENIVYTKVENKEMLLDLFHPKIKKRALSPAVILIHGGGWHSGSKTMEHPISVYLAERGYVAVNVEYRMAKEFLYPAGVYDIKTSIRWLKANAKKYNVDTNKIAVLGCSAGAELATFMGTTGNIAKFEGDGGYKNHSSKVQAIVNIDGIVDFLHRNSTKFDDNPEKPCAANIWLGGNYKVIADKWKEASPITYVDANTPPIVFINSALEDYHAGRDEFIAKLNEHKIYYEIHTIPNTPHPFWLFHPWYKTTCKYTYEFLNKIFKKR